jgi:hypothetical protein
MWDITSCYNLLKLYPKIIIFVAWFLNVVFLLSFSIVSLWINLNKSVYVSVTAVVFYLILYESCWWSVMTETCTISIFWVMTNLTHSFLMYLFHASTCFEQQVFITRRTNLYQYIIWYNTLWWVTVWRAGQEDRHVSHPPECVIPDDVLIQFCPPVDDHLLLETCTGTK